MRCGSLILAVSIMLSGCKVGPNYKRPNIPVPPSFRGGEPHPSRVSLANEKWFNLFQDNVLRALINEALDANFDILIAAQRIVEAEGQLAATRSALFPHLDGETSASRIGIRTPTQSIREGFAIATWELDLFGKFRRATEAARAELLASEENRQAVIQSLIAQVASAYFDLREFDYELEIVRESIKTRQDSVRLVDARVRGGVASDLDLDQAKSLVERAQSDAIRLEQGQVDAENLISFLLGRTPGPIARGRSLVDQPYPAEVPAGLPSELLDRRPDIRAAEQDLVAANAQVGVAKAAFFPSVTLTAAGGVQAVDLLGLFQRSGKAYELAGVVDVPIFDAGRRAGDYKTAKAQRQELVVNYQKVIYGAFRDVSDALNDHRKAKEFVLSQQVLTATLQDQTRLATQRYEGGVSSYLEVLDTERQRLTAEQDLAQARRDVLKTLVQLYQALGGGWQ